MSKRPRDNNNSAVRAMRNQKAREQRRKRVWTTVIVVFAVAVVGMLTWMFFLTNEARQVNTPASANAAGNAIATGSGPIVVENYSDFLCPYCKLFHGEAEVTLKQLLTEGKITYLYHPVAYLNRFSTNEYPTRASAASGCASDGGKFHEYVKVLFENQPPEGGPGPTDDQLIAFGNGIGLGDSFASCIRDKRYVTWSGKVSDDATEAGVTGTPTVLVNGKKVQSSPAAILQAIAAASGTPSPTPS